MADQGALAARFTLVHPVAPDERAGRAVANETAIAIEINGLGYAVMMATPLDLEDFVTGFCLAERLIKRAVEITAFDSQPVAAGWIARLTITGPGAARLHDRARLRVAEGSCGLCGLESLEQAVQPLPPVTARLILDAPAVFRALDALPAWQTLNAATGAMHAAAFCAADGGILAVREDVGRHNALDKLIGALARQGRSASDGFLLVTARCSYELVQKAILANCAQLVSVSAATSLALEQASAHGLRLISLARADGALVSTPL